MQTQAAESRERLLEEGAADQPASLHVAAATNQVVSLYIQLVHLVDLSQVVGQVSHGHQHRPGFHRLQTSLNGSGDAFAITVLGS